MAQGRPGEAGETAPPAAPPQGSSGQGSGALPHPIFNWSSVVGIALVVASGAGLVFFALIDLGTSAESGYAALTLLPPALVGGLGCLLVYGGFVRERRRRRGGLHSSFIDSSVVAPLAVVRRVGPLALLAGVALFAFALLGAGAGSVAMVEMTESNQFCGQVCHAVMTPEATVFQDSPHARLDCVECHVGGGAESYLRSKLSGLRQVYHIATGQVSRPIATPIRDRRLSTEMCESCHTRDRLGGYKALIRTYYTAGKETEPDRLGMLLNTGGTVDGGEKSRRGIHYHMLAASKVEYIARDAQRQEIPWVRVTGPTGEVREFSNEDDPLSDQERASLEVRQIECIDCHSRPAHQFTPPVRSLNAALAAGRIPASLPRIKEAGVLALDGGYASTSEAMEQIDARLRSFYEDEDPEVLERDAAALAQATDALRDIYRRTIFPEMKADWRAHPDNIGHLEFPGCFRCHNDEMVDAEGEALFQSCSDCHAVLAENGEGIASVAQLDRGREFVHPDDDDTFDDEFTLCTDCHTGGADIYE